MSAANTPDRPVDTVTGAARERARQIRSLREQGESLDEIAALYGVSRERVRQILRAHGGPDRQQVAQARQLRAAQLVESPSLATILNRMGGWRSALQSAGQPTPWTTKRTRSRRWTAEACWAVLRDVTWELGTIPTIAAYDRYAADRAELPSSSTLRNRLGGWNAITTRLAGERSALQHAAPDPNRPPSGMLASRMS